MEEVFITMAEKRTVMCLYGVTGHSGHVDQTLRSVHPEFQCLQCDRTRPVVISPLWNLTGVDRTLALSVRSHQTISPWSNELTGLCANVRSTRNQRPVSI